jgi:hypothetical protein
MVRPLSGSMRLVLPQSTAAGAACCRHQTQRAGAHQINYNSWLPTGGGCRWNARWSGRWLLRRCWQVAKRKHSNEKWEGFLWRKRCAPDVTPLRRTRLARAMRPLRASKTSQIHPASRLGQYLRRCKQRPIVGCQILGRNRRARRPRDLYFELEGKSLKKTGRRFLHLLRSRAGLRKTYPFRHGRGIPCPNACGHRGGTGKRADWRHHYAWN